MLKSKLFSVFGACSLSAAQAIKTSLTRLLMLGGLLAPLTTVCPAQSNVITEFPLTSSAASFPENIVYGTNAFTTNSGYWFTEFSGQRIGYINVTNATASNNILTEIGLSAGANPFGIASVGNTIWFTESGLNRIGYVTNNTFVDFALPDASSEPATMIADPGGLLWFIEYNLNKIAAFNPAAPVTNGTLSLMHDYGPFSHPGSLSSQMLGLTTGPDGNIWFAEATWGIIGRLNPLTGVSNEFVLPQTNCEPNSIVSGSDGALWFTEFTGNKIGRITTNGQVTEYSLPISPSYPNPQPYGILSPGDGNIWFTEYYGAAVGRFTPSTVAPPGVFTIFPTPTASSTPTFLTTGADTNIWFGERASGGSSLVDDLIGRLIVAQALSLSPSNVTVSGTNFNGTLATFQNSNLTNLVTVSWGDGTTNTLLVTNVLITNTISFSGSWNSSSHVPSASAASTFFVSSDSLTVSVISTSTNGTTPVYTYNVSGTHNYPGSPAVGPITISITDSFNDFTSASIPLGPAFFAGQTFVTTNIYSLHFPNGNNFGYYFMGSFPYVYHFDLGWEYFVDANDPSSPGAAYLYDFTSNRFFYTSPSLFPYLYDFNLNTWLYYYPDPARAGHYTTGPRYFYNFTTKQIITL